jgi:transcription-repair coupling factor (superfamily II helicase)
VDLFPPLYEQPLRLEFWGDELESIRPFDPATQRSQGPSLEDLVVLPVSEVILTEAARERALAGRSRRQDPTFWHHVHEGIPFPGSERHLAEFYEQPETLWDYLPADTLVVLWDPLNISQTLEKLAESTGAEPAGWLDDTPLEVRRAPYAALVCEVLPFGPESGEERFQFQVEKYTGLARELAAAAREDGRLIPALAQRLAAWQEEGRHAVLVSRNRHRGQRLAELLAAEDLEVRFNPDPCLGGPGSGGGHRGGNFRRLPSPCGRTVPHHRR